MRRTREIDRRAVLRGAAALPLAGFTAGCAGLARTAGLGDYVRVAVSWSGAELAAFVEVLDQRAVPNYEVVPLGDDTGAVLGARTAGRPDIVAVPQVGHVTANATKLAELPDGLWREEYRRIWPAASAGGRHLALPFKLAHSSVVWYRKGFFARHGLSTPTTWSDWIELNERIIDIDAGLAPLAIGGADGWLLAKFFENVLLRTFEGTFVALSRPHRAALWASADVRAAFEMVATMWGQAGALPGGADRALVQQFPDAVLDVCRYDRAVMVPAPDFAESVIRRFAPDPAEFDTFDFPSRDGEDAPYVVSSDLLVLTRPASGAAQDLLRFLATPDAPVPWISGTGGFIAANPRTDLGHYSSTLRRLALALRGHPIRFGLADQLGRLGGSEGLQRVLQDLLRAVAAGDRPRDVAGAACAAMVDAKRRTG
jgi:alpha-glucoside transport system substrate-binding protein